MSPLHAIASDLPARKGRPLVAWLVILAVVAFILYRYQSTDLHEQERYDLLTTGFQGRYLVGLEQLEKKLQPTWSDAGLYAQAREALFRHTYAQRLRFIVLAGELKGPAEACEQLQLLNDIWRENHLAPAEDEAETAGLLARLYAAREKNPSTADPLPEQERQMLRDRLGWFGDLALTPAEGSDPAARAAVLAPAWRSLWSLLVAGLMLVLGFLGLTLLVVLGVLWTLGHLRGGLRCGASHGGIYAETFAVYMLLFLGLGFAGRYFLSRFEIRGGSLALSGLAALGSLLALAWPVLRGIPWRQVRQDIGWRAGRRPWLEPFLGFGCYAMALSMLLPALLLMMGLTALRDRLGWGPNEFGPSESPSHPIAFSVTHAGWWVWLEVLFVASIVAPLVEETMFRGVLYRHLREASFRLPPALSVLLSALVVSFLFAVIHPQGFLAVPLLMSLALAFTLMREWRGTLLPAMIAHGINNAVATTMLFFLIG